MKRRQKLYTSLAVFLILATLAIVFVLSDLDKSNVSKMHISPNNAPTSNQTVKNSDASEQKQNNNKTDRQQVKNINWQPIIDSWKGKEISQLKTGKKVIALTFDAGGTADGVDKILEILKNENVKGTVFLTGRFIEKYPDETGKIISSGVDLGNHTYSHPHFVQLNLSRDQINQELEKTEKLLSNLGAKFLPFFRFPYGEKNKQGIEYINDKNYISVRWSIDSLGWKGLSGGMSKDLVQDRVLKQIAPGAIVLMHLGSNPDDGTNLDSEALSEIIQKLKDDGYSFVTIADLLTEK